MAKRVGKQWSFLLLGLWLAFWPQTSPLSLFDLGSVAAIGAVFAGLNSNWYPTYKATNRFMSSYQVSEKENIVKREVVEAIKNNVQELKMKDHATIISGREMAGQQWKTPWGAPVVFSGSASNTRTGRASCTRSWEVRTRTCSSKSYAVSANDLRNSQNLTKFPILLLDIPRETPTGRSLVSFKAINIPSLVPVRRHDLPRGTSLQPMEPVIFQLMSRPLSTFEVGRSP